MHSLDLVGAVSPAREVREVELDLIPALVEAHGHCAHEGFHARGGLVVGGAEPAHLVLVVEHTHFKAEFLLQVLDDHDQERQFDRQGLDFVDFMRAADPAGCHVRGTDFDYG